MTKWMQTNVKREQRDGERERVKRSERVKRRERERGKE